MLLMVPTSTVIGLGGDGGRKKCRQAAATPVAAASTMTEMTMTGLVFILMTFIPLRMRSLDGSRRRLQLQVRDPGVGRARAPFGWGDIYEEATRRSRRLKADPV